MTLALAPIVQAAPGVVAVALLAGAALAAGLVTPIPPLLAAVALGAIGGGRLRSSEVFTPGLEVASRRFIRVGVVLLGFQLAAADVLALGPAGLVAVCALVGFTFGVTRWLGRRLGVSPGLSLLIASGFSICGASAIAAVAASERSDDDETAYGITLVTLCGTVAMVALPLLQAPLGLSAVEFGRWAGASIHDVAQVVAASSAAGEAGLEAAVVVKLSRVLLLVPIVLSLSVRHSTRQPGRSAPVPLFALGFVAAAGLRSMGLVSPEVATGAKTVATVLFAIALAALGCALKPAELLRVGGRPLALGAISTILITSVALAGVRLS